MVFDGTVTPLDEFLESKGSKNLKKKLVASHSVYDVKPARENSAMNRDNNEYYVINRDVDLRTSQNQSRKKMSRVQSTGKLSTGVTRKKLNRNLQRSPSGKHMMNWVSIKPSR